MKTKQNIQPTESMPSTAGNFEQLLAKFQENPIEFKNYIMDRPKPSLTKTESNVKIEKLWDEYTKLKKQEGKSDEIIRCMDSIIHLDPKVAFAWFGKGNALYDLEKYEESLECYDKSIKLDPKMAHTWNNNGNVLGRLGKKEESIKCYDKAIELDPKHALPWFNKGVKLTN